VTGDESPHARLIGLTQEVAALRQLLHETRTTQGEHGEALEELTDAHRKTPPPFSWDDLSPEDRERREAALRVWVDVVLRVWHPHVGTALRPCWWDHLHVRAHVTAAWLAWEGAYRARGRKPTDPADWIERRLPALHAALTNTWSARQPCDTHGGP
jgi:hypothetical protein